jgi:hypothetical protein
MMMISVMPRYMRKIECINHETFSVVELNLEGGSHISIHFDNMENANKVKDILNEEVRAYTKLSQPVELSDVPNKIPAE